MVKENLYFKLKQTNMCIGGKSVNVFFFFWEVKSVNVFSWESKSLNVEMGYNAPFSSCTY